MGKKKGSIPLGKKTPSVAQAAKEMYFKAPAGYGEKKRRKK